MAWADAMKRRMSKSRQIQEDNPGWNPQTMGNKRGSKSSFVMNPNTISRRITKK